MIPQNICVGFLAFFITLEANHCLTVFNTRPIAAHNKPNRKEIPLSLAFKHKATEKFVKRLEYAANSNDVTENTLDFGLVPIDLNYLSDDMFADDIEDGVEDELAKIDKELGENTTESADDKLKFIKIMTVSLMHQGMYDQSPEYNSLIDGLIRNVKRDILKRKMDPLYFHIHDRGVVRHTINKTEFLSEPLAVDDESRSKNAIGGGDIKGLLKLKRFGNAESRRDGDISLVRSHYFFGPLEIDLVYQGNRGLRTLNSTLSSLAAHALFQVSHIDNSTSLLEFLTDSPMEYEIQLQGSRNRRFRRLSQTAIMRLFRRDGRLEVRMLRSFRRGASKPIRPDTEQRQNQDKEQLRNSKTKRPKEANPKL